jgi:hypothetical protein
MRSKFQSIEGEIVPYDKAFAGEFSLSLHGKTAYFSKRYPSICCFLAGVIRLTNPALLHY